MLLHLQVEAVLAEGLREPGGRLARLVVLPLPQPEGDLAREAGRQADDSLVVRRQHLAIDPGPAVESLGETDRTQPDQVAVAGLVPCQEDQVRIVGRRPGRPRRFGPRPEGQVGLEAEDGPDPLLAGLVVEVPGRVEVAVVGHRQRVHPQFLDVPDQLREPVGAVEQGILAVGVEVYERHRPANRTGMRCDCQKLLSCLGLGRFLPAVEARWMLLIPPPEPAGPALAT